MEFVFCNISIPVLHDEALPKAVFQVCVVVTVKTDGGGVFSTKAKNPRPNLFGSQPVKKNVASGTSVAHIPIPRQENEENPSTSANPLHNNKRLSTASHVTDVQSHFTYELMACTDKPKGRVVGAWLT